MALALKNKHILISGASIAGPALAYWLTRYGFSVTVVEKAPAIREGGYRVDIRGTAVDIVERMGLFDEIKAKESTMRGSSVVNRKGERLVNFDDPNLFGMRQERDVEIMRGDLANVLYEATREEVNYIFDDTIVCFEEVDDRVLVQFKRGEARIFDLVVGADGLHSRVRSLAFEEDRTCIHHLGYYVAVFGVPNTFNLDHWELLYSSNGKAVNVFSMNEQEEAKVYCLFSTTEPVKYHHQDIPAQKKILLDHFRQEEGFITELLPYLSDTDDFYFDSISQVRLSALSSGRTVLLGDAGYCASPASGQGTSLALVGAYILAGELAKTAGEHTVAFAAYEQEMRTYIEKNQELGVWALEEMVPHSRKQAWFQLFMLRVLIRLPWRKQILKSFLKKIQETVDAAANAIRPIRYEEQY